jgi:hypothetical protein
MNCTHQKDTTPRRADRVEILFRLGRFRLGFAMCITEELRGKVRTTGANRLHPNSKDGILKIIKSNYGSKCGKEQSREFSSSCELIMPIKKEK